MTADLRFVIYLHFLGGMQYVSCLSNECRTSSCRACTPPSGSSSDAAFQSLSYRRSRPGAVPDYCFTVDGRRMLYDDLVVRVRVVGLGWL